MIRLFDKVMVEVKWLLPFYFFTFLPFSLSAQRLTVANTTVNAGRTGYLQPITATFELKNKSRKKLYIEDVHPDCGCTAVEFPKEVDGGAKFTIKMTYDAKMLGHFQKMAAVTSNGSKAMPHSRRYISSTMVNR